MVDVVRSRAARLLKVALIALAALLATGCSAHDVLGFGWPDGVTPQAERMRELWIWSALAALIIGVIVWGLILWTVVFHRKRTDDMPRQTQYNLPLEIFYTVVPFVIVAVLFYFTATAQNFVMHEVEDPDQRVAVVGFQWNWEFVYLQDDANAQGEYAPMQTQAGTPLSTVGSSDTVPLLVVPTERVVEYQLRSTDVLHSFFVPEFLFKRDVFPFPEKNNSDNVFQTTVDRQGAFVGRCAELCGTYHSQMSFELRALPVDLFERYLDLRARVNPATQEPYTAGEALQQLNCGRLCSPQAVTTSPLDTERTSTQPAGTGTN